MKTKILNVVGFLSEDTVDGKKVTKVSYKLTIADTYKGRNKDGKEIDKNSINVALTSICANLMPYGIMIQSYVAQHANKIVISDVLSSFIVGSDIEFDTQIQPVGTIINGEATKVETCKVTIKSIKPVENPILEQFRLQMIADLPKRVEKLVEEMKNQAKAVLPNPFAMVATPTTPTE